jgi:hypothetical protein
MVNAIGATYLYVNCTSFIITFSLVVTMDTLCSAALGANQKYLMGLCGYGITALDGCSGWFFLV